MNIFISIVSCFFFADCFKSFVDNFLVHYLLIKMLKAPTKITFKNFTKMTLNARFTSIMKSRPPANTQVKPQVSTEKLASEKNRRLALQMENRHSIKPVPAATVPAHRPSVRDRLGTARGHPTRRLSQGVYQSATSSRARGILRGALRRGGLYRQGARGKLGATKSFAAPLNRVSRGGVQKRGNFRGRGRGRGKSISVDKSKLDNELDSYMSKTKGSMDAELDEYMANIGSK